MTKSIFWFRQDLRLIDNPGLWQALQESTDVLLLYIHEPGQQGQASQVWLHHALHELNKTVQNRLTLKVGSPHDIIPRLVEEQNIKAVYWNRCYEPERIEVDTALKKHLKEQGVICKSFNGSLLWEPWTVLKADQTPYRVFTPFYRKGCLAAPPPRSTYPMPDLTNVYQGPTQNLQELKLLPETPWHQKMMSQWQVGSQAALARLNNFLEQGLHAYKEGRNFPAKNHVSRLSPYLHFGEISPHQIWWAVQETLLQQEAPIKDIEHFLSELGWREFSYYLLYHFPHLPVKNFQPKFDRFPWREDPNALQRWQQGQTGYPIVDAGMRELWQTGYMHNRVRMIVGSFLVKNLLIDWRHGERWFWECLVDADRANNSASWQWVAGSGADAAPYFRIFNPVTQGEKFDPLGTYTRRYLPELADLPEAYLFQPWTAPPDILTAAGITLGVTYPHPIVDLKTSRAAALSAFEQLKEKEA